MIGKDGNIESQTHQHIHTYCTYCTTDPGRADDYHCELHTWSLWLSLINFRIQFVSKRKGHLKRAALSIQPNLPLTKDTFNTGHFEM